MAASDTIAVAIRFRDGRVVCQERSAAPTPHWFRDARFLAGDEAFIQQYVDLAKLAQNDAQIPVGPAGHGLVVFDLRDGAYLTMQSNFDYRALELTWFGQFRNPQYLRIMTALAEAGRLRLRTRRPGEPERIGPVVSVQDVLDIGERVHKPGNGDPTEDVLIDVSPFRHVGFPMDADGMAKLRTELSKLGFETAAEDAWSGWLTGRSAEKPKAAARKPAKPKAAKPKRRAAASRQSPHQAEGS